jgi:predicted TIM-barrel fold metal-dependent hydrolase
MGRDYPVVDAHHHIGRKEGYPGGEFSGSDLVRRMEQHAIAAAVVMHFVSVLRSPEDFIRANSYVAEAVARYPDRLFGAVAINPLFGDLALAEIERYAAAGFRAVKLHPIFHGNYRVNGGAVDDVAALAGQLGLPVVIHSDFTSSACTPYEIAGLAGRFPDTCIVLLHLGLHPELCKHVSSVVRSSPNVMVDTSQTPDFPREVYVNPVRELGADRVLFGSDGPECDVSLNLRKLEIAVAECGLREDEAKQVLSANAVRLFRLSIAAPAQAQRTGR